MTTSRTWWLRAVLGVAAFAGLELLFVLTGSTPDPVRLALVVALVVCAGSLVVDATPVESAAWPVHAEPATGLARQDPRTASYLRLLESHLTAREPDAALRERLRQLADQVLRVRHDLAPDDPRAGELLGLELRRVLSEPPRRLDPAQIERCVRRIEEM